MEGATLFRTISRARVLPRALVTAQAEENPQSETAAYEGVSGLGFDPYPKPQAPNPKPQKRVRLA